MGNKLKYWESRKIGLPIPLWLEMERQWGAMKSRQCDGRDWRIDSFEIMASIINYLTLPKNARHAIRFALESAWLKPRLDAMVREYDRSANQEQAEAAAMQFHGKLPPGQLSTMAEDDPLSLLVGMIRTAGAAHQDSLARECIQLIQDRILPPFDWVPPQETGNYRIRDYTQFDGGAA